MKRQSLFPFIVIGFLLTCQNQSGSDERPFAGREEDLAAPIAGGNIYFTNVTDNSITVNWPAAKDNRTHPNQLRYRLVKAFTATEIDSISKVDGVTGFDLLVDYQENVTSYTVTGLSPNTTYYFAVVVKDEAQNKALYQPAAQATSGPATFNVVSATSTSNTSVTVTFSDPPNSGQANTASNYKIVGGSDPCTASGVLAVSAASLSGSTVTLTTASQSAISYKVCVSGVTRQSDGANLTTNSATFTGTGAGTNLPYNFTDWADTSNAGTYPPDMQFFCVTSSDPSNTQTIGNLWSGPYNLTSNARIRGENANGIGFINTTTGQTANCSGASPAQFAGVVVLSLNTTGKSSIVVRWRGRSITAYTAGTNRQFKLTLEYSTDGGASWTFAPEEYLGNTTAGHDQLLTTNLPAAANNNPNVRLRWRYVYVTGSGTRQHLALDDISIDGT